MRNHQIIIILFSLLFSDPFESLDTDFLKAIKKNSPQQIGHKSPKDKEELPQFDEVIKNCIKIEGLFTFYWNQDKNKLFMELSSEQLNSVYLFNMTRSSGDGMYYDGGSMLWEYPFIFEQIGEKIQLVNINTSFRADSNTPIYKAVTENLPNSINGVTSILSSPKYTKLTSLS